ncbi:L-serine ammonia-lyase, iron-sulfur-dependent, subunit alpha [Salsuginibacillus kocurii]|uniref:L-serine ammonia-lyase, iron-sulfur-dependent, subunit alpha n=1 Tax=Salsuginibacillus kocurii TaxID=427078 RepID=UPI00036029BA|nr:L-serine ammonia-lyase, iron-sulfur-dependent, subunit alpha [Salsuginibacillus kocurii]
MFRNAAELVERALAENISAAEVMIQQEMQLKNRSKAAVMQDMDERLAVMEEAVRRGTSEEVTSVSGLTGGDALKIQTYMKEHTPLSGATLLDAVSKAMATNEVNAAMGTICATPTAGSAGVVPGTLFAVKEQLQPSREDMIHYLFTSGAFGMVVANNASISGAAGGCQAEVGSAAGMAAAATVELAGGTPEQAADAMAIALKNMLGLVCDPVAGLVEVPCVKRNAAGASIAMMAADMALAGVKSRIPCDEVIVAMYKIGENMSDDLKETARGGLAATPTGRALETEIFNISLERS